MPTEPVTDLLIKFQGLRSPSLQIVSGDILGSPGRWCIVLQTGDGFNEIRTVENLQEGLTVICDRAAGTLKSKPIQRRRLLDYL